MSYPIHVLVAIGIQGEFVVLYEGSRDIAETMMHNAKKKDPECVIGIMTWEEYMSKFNTKSLPKPDEE